eukprot:gnl/MRDRNA2_/MRDRNA2_75637_c0_seq1.p1 gnl/MRDRNA2_/MRDRNA2_75637_c0~~gnl/MRDRNA2_/MRDRNA2_75637_c0_seq1.p1  ORF type:complete len:572 (-),score=58.20 gnl/MRDRNA2_/MRDRNA2_75637_c0_seq1:120-1835(-)
MISVHLFASKSAQRQGMPLSSLVRSPSTTPRWISLLLSVAIMRVAGQPPSPWQTVAGTGKSGFGGDTYSSSVHDFSVESRLNSPWGLALDKTHDRLYIADTLNHVVRSADLTTGLMETVVGTGVPGFSGDGSAGSEAQLQMPTGLALDESRQILYLSDMHNHRVRAVDLRVGKTYQAEVPGQAVLNGPQTHEFCTGQSLILEGSDFCAGSTGQGYATYVKAITDYIDFNVIVDRIPGQYWLRFRYADRPGDVHSSGGRLMRLILNGTIVTHAMRFPPTGRPGAGTKHRFQWSSIKVNLQQTATNVRLEVTGHSGPHIDQLYVVPASNTTINTIAGTGNSNDAMETPGSEVIATATSLLTPLGLAIDSIGRMLYVADADHGRVRRINMWKTPATIETIAGGNPTGNDHDGVDAITGKLFRPQGLALDSARHYLYISDSVQHKVRRVDLTTTDPDTAGKIITVAGVGEKYVPFELRLRAPSGLVIDDATDTLYVSDKEHARIRAVDLPKAKCPNRFVSRNSCGAHSGVSPALCAKLGCCFDAMHPDCATPFNPDGRLNLAGFQSEDALTKLDG